MSRGKRVQHLPCPDAFTATAFNPRAASRGELVRHLIECFRNSLPADRWSGPAGIMLCQQMDNSDWNLELLAIGFHRQMGSTLGQCCGTTDFNHQGNRVSTLGPSHGANGFNACFGSLRSSPPATCWSGPTRNNVMCQQMVRSCGEIGTIPLQGLIGKGVQPSRQLPLNLFLCH